MADEKIFTEPTEAETKMLRDFGSADPNVSLSAGRGLAVALEEPLRQGIMAGDITQGIFEVVTMAPGATPEFALDLLAPGTEKDFVAYVIPRLGKIPERKVEADYITVPYFGVANSIDWALRFAEDARWDVVARAIQVFRDGFVKKQNDDCFHTLVAAAVDRNILVYDSDASAGQFTKRLISLTKTVMRRNGGGNSTSLNRGKLTDVFISPEGVEDIRDWKVDQVDEITRNKIFNAPDGSLNGIYGVVLHDIDELGEDQEYQNYFTTTLGGSLASGDLELAIGLDLTKRGAFVMPVRSEVQMFPDPALHRKQKAGYYGWRFYGVANLDSRSVIALSF